MNRHPGLATLRSPPRWAWGPAAEATAPPAPALPRLRLRRPPREPPNVVLIFVDDLGWGDLSSFGHPLIRTPNVDALAAEGARLVDFSTPASVCAPSRAAILTGRYPIRVGVPWNPPERLNADELTIADLLRSAGYVTGMVGKWHLGWQPPDMPIHHGFDTFYGKVRFAGEVIEGDQPTAGVPLELLTRQYTARAVAFIHENSSRPFFLYLAYHAPHSPYLPSDLFAGTSPAGEYGDVVEEMDWGVGEVLRALEETGVDRDTLVLFTSDNGPELPPGSAGPFRGGKGWPTEGGVRVPAAARWPARIPAGTVVEEITSVLDVAPTLVALAGARLPSDRSYDGVDITPLLTGAVIASGGPGSMGGARCSTTGAPTRSRSAPAGGNTSSPASGAGDDALRSRVGPGRAVRPGVRAARDRGATGQPHGRDHPELVTVIAGGDMPRAKRTSPRRGPIRRLAINTGGGDAPGLNAVIRAVVLSAVDQGWECIGIRDGYNGIFKPEEYPDGGLVPLTRARVRGITHLGGTIIGTTNRGNPLKYPTEMPDGTIKEVDRTDDLVEGLRRPGDRRGGGDRGRRLPHHRQRPGQEGRAHRGGAQDHRQRPLGDRRSPSASTPRCPSPPSASTGCTPPPRPTAGSWWWR